jgi:hypothetical protein
MPGLGGAVEAGPDVEWGEVFEGTRKDSPIGAVLDSKDRAAERDEALKQGIAKARFVWVGAKAECGHR